MDNVGEFTSKAFDDYCMAMGIKVEHSVPHVHSQNGLAEALIKRIKFIARPLLQGCNLPTTCWGHAVLHAANVINFRPSAYNIHSPVQLAQGSAPKISYLHRFGCQVYVPIPPPQRSVMGPLHKSGKILVKNAISKMSRVTVTCHGVQIPDYGHSLITNV